MADVNRFRLLIIGKTGCGKTTILSKVCGEDVTDRPSTSRGIHDIEREIQFRNNDKLVAHDSEGFEAGQSAEGHVVNAFIEGRAKMADINDRLHMVWYCMEMNSRPIQHAEKIFFSIRRPVPVIVIATKFEIFVQDVLQELEEAAEANDEEFDDEKFEADAEKLAKDRFDQFFVEQLKALPFPPSFVVALSRTHESRSDDSESRLTELVTTTLKALQPDEDSDLTPEKRRDMRRLEELFVTAQTADVSSKIYYSICVGMADNYRLNERHIQRLRLVETWNTAWSFTNSVDRFVWLQSQCEKLFDRNSRTIGHPESPDRYETSQWRSKLLQECAFREHIIMDTVMLMKHIFLLRAEDTATVSKLFEWYTTRSNTAQEIRRTLLERHRQNSSAVVGLPILELVAIASELPVEVPDFVATSIPLDRPTNIGSADYITSLNVGPSNDSSRRRPAFVSKLFNRVGKKLR